MGNPKKDTKHFRPEHLGLQSHAADGNKGKQMSSKTNEQPDLIQQKG
ncbi:acid-soluble spore protein N [Aquibacillus kalidii]|nr:acid-soluble spore protein N [Aquibacillus kalidii]